MCAINPKRQHHFTLSVYTTHEMIEAQWQRLIAEKALEAEMKLNSDMRLRWHLTEGASNAQTS